VQANTGVLADVQSAGVGRLEGRLIFGTAHEHRPGDRAPVEIVAIRFDLYGCRDEQ
jgi:hypothetical protein